MAQSSLLQHLRADFLAALSVTAVAVPTAMAYAELANFPPVVGLYSSIFPLVIYAFLGSSPQLIVGPDAATCTIVATALVPLALSDPIRYLALSITLSIIVGLFCVVAGIFRLGMVADFLSRPILIGFMNGVALTIVSKQLGSLCGFALTDTAGFFMRVMNFWERLRETNIPTLVVGLVTIVLIWACTRFVPRVPGPLVGVAAGLVIAQVFDLEKRAVATVAPIPSGLPSPKLPVVSLDDVQTLSFIALGVLLVSFCSEIATAKSFAARNGYKVDPNRELIALGVANFASGISQGFVVSGADSRTAISDVAGGKTRMTGVYTAGFITLVLLFLTGPLSTVPKCSLAGILIVAGASLFDLSGTIRLYHLDRREFYISSVATFGVITIGVGAGIIIAVLLSIATLLVDVSRPHDAILGRILDTEDYGDIAAHPGAQNISNLLIYRFDAAVLFFNAEYFKKRIQAAIDSAPTKIQTFLFDAEAVTAIDITAALVLQEVQAELASRGTNILIARARTALREQFDQYRVFDRNVERYYPSVRSAVDAFKADESKRTSASETNLEYAEPDKKSTTVSDGCKR